MGWRKKHKAPTDWGFAVKPASLQTKSSKHIKYLCTDDAAAMHRWITGIRVAKVSFLLIFVIVLSRIYQTFLTKASNKCRYLRNVSN